MYKRITQQVQTVVTKLLEQARLKPGSMPVIGYSSSEIVGKRIGKGASKTDAQATSERIYPIRLSQGIHLAVQRCEHLNHGLECICTTLPFRFKPVWIISEKPLSVCQNPPQVYWRSPCSIATVTTSEFT